MSREDITHREPLSLFWYWINERHQIYLNRHAGEPKPWSEDDIFLDYKFTNAFRELDTGTVWLRENFREPHADDPEELLVFNMCWYRKFNWIPTAKYLGWQTQWDPTEAHAILYPHRGEQLVTGAHFSIAPPYMPRWEGMLETISDMWDVRHDITNVALGTKSLEKTFDELLEIQYVGPFIAYEIVSDIRHTRVLNDAVDIYTWANPGPGARRGLRRLGLEAKPDTVAIKNMRDLLEQSQDRLSYAVIEPWKPHNSHLLGRHVPPLEMRDIEHCLCEFDKYCRVYRGEGRPRSKYNGRS